MRIARAPFAESFVRTPDGLRLYYRRYEGGASRPPVLCLHGLTRNSRDFEDIAAYLARSAPVFAFDLRGRGRSEYDRDWRRYHLGTYVSDVLALLDALSVENSVLLGTSLGGLIAMAIARAQPQRLIGVVLNDIGPELAPRGVARIAGYAGKLPPVSSWPEAARQAREVNEIAFPDLDEADWLAFARRTYREEPGGRIRVDMDPNVGQALAEAGPLDSDPWTLFDALKDIPALVIRGELSDLLSPETLDRMAARKPDLRVCIVPNRGHAPMLNEPQALAAIDTFMASL